ncbi:hypothetical protein [Nostoc sp. TCL240-02]|nr:hypothetical protein [Nostoc sp. TCL240-02]
MLSVRGRFQNGVVHPNEPIGGIAQAHTSDCHFEQAGFTKLL